MLGGPEIITFLLLALGGALAVGNIAALLHPDGPQQKRQRPQLNSPPLSQPPSSPPPSLSPQATSSRLKAKLWRSLVMIAVGLIIVVWSLASLIGG